MYNGSKNISFDPVMLEGNLPPADIILVSHAYPDHAERESLKKTIAPGNGLNISPNGNGFYTDHADELGVAAIIRKEGESSAVDDIIVEAVPAFDDRFHFRSAEGAGFVVTIDLERIYFAGGTRMFPEMSLIISDVTLYPWYRNSDILATAEILQTKVLIPVHAGESGVKAYVDVYAKEITRLKIIVLVPGPDNPWVIHPHDGFSIDEDCRNNTDLGKQMGHSASNGRTALVHYPQKLCVRCDSWTLRYSKDIGIGWRIHRKGIYYRRHNIVGP